MYVNLKNEIVKITSLKITPGASPELMDTANNLYHKREGGAYGGKESSFQP